MLCVALNYFVLEEGETAHEWSGYIAAGLVCAHIVWGFVGATPVSSISGRRRTASRPTSVTCAIPTIFQMSATTRSVR